MCTAFSCQLCYLNIREKWIFCPIYHLFYFLAYFLGTGWLNRKTPTNFCIATLSYLIVRLFSNQCGKCSDILLVSGYTYLHTLYLLAMFGANRSVALGDGYSLVEVHFRFSKHTGSRETDCSHWATHYCHLVNDCRINLPQIWRVFPKPINYLRITTICL